jgi:SAM-dependent methyltransferase
MLAHERRSGSLSSGFVSSMVFPGVERQQQNFAAWKDFWNHHRITALEKSLKEASLKFGFTANAFEPFFEMLNADSYNPETMAMPQKFFGLMGITADPEKKTWLKGYRAEAFYAKYGTLGKLFDPNFFSQKLGRLLFATFTKMLVIIGVSVTILLFLYFVDLSLTLISLLPVIFALISTLATLNLIGHPLDIPGLMLAIIVVGMGIDYSLFFVRSYQRYGDPAHPYFGLIRMTVFLAGASTIIGFGVLCTAQHSLLRSAGITSLLGIGYSLIGAFIILPPLLKYRLRTRQEDKPKQGRIQDRVLWRYKNLEAYPRLFARFKMHFDPMFSEDIGCGYGVQTAWLLERFQKANVVGIDPDADRVRIAARVAGRRASIKSGSAPDIPAVSQPADLVIMLDITHYLNDEALRLTFKNIYDRLAHGRQLIIRASIPPTRPTPWVWWFENFKLKLNQTPSYYRGAETLQTMLVEADFNVDQAKSSGAHGELVWLMVTKKKSNEKN